MRLLIDSGSELTFISEQLTLQLNLPRQTSSLTINGIGGSRSTQTLGSTQLQLKSFHSMKTVILEAHILKRLTSLIPSIKVTHSDWPQFKGLSLADPDYHRPRAVDIIIGADHYGSVIEPQIIRGDVGSPVAQLSIFGWILIGPVNVVNSASGHAHQITAHQQDALNEFLTRFWEQEEVPSTAQTMLTPAEEECEAHFLATHTRDESGRYIVRIPLIASPAALGESREAASACLKRTIRRLNKDAHYRQLYTTFLKEYDDLGHMRRISDGESELRKNLAHGSSESGGLRVLREDSIDPSSAHPPVYLPHHGVLTPHNTSTKLRVVFNGSSPTSSGKSINDIMHTGPNLLLCVMDVLIWIRQHRHIFATDITKMYRQIKVHKEDWNLQRILWIDDQLNEIPFHLTTVTYGTRSAPFLATRVLLQLVNDEGSSFPLAVPSLTHGRYVDDIFGGADTISELTTVAHQIIGLCNAGGFPLAKWRATAQRFLSDSSVSWFQTDTVSLDDCETKLLGLKWIPQEDKFIFSSRFDSPPRKLTKRLVLSEVAQIFDPLGLVSPVVIQAKFLLQELWLLKLGWDDPLPASLSSRWLSIRNQLNALASVSVPRWLNTWSDSTVELHGFSDASQLAMGAVIYLTVGSLSTSSHSTGSHSILVCSKTKVAPLKRLTIPRLELTAALMLTRLVAHLKATLKLKVSAIHLWTDSQVTLNWIRSHPSRWKDYVRNRVTQIQELCTDTTWRHVPGSMNPADCASRGVNTDQLKDHPLWWTGPQWLTKSQTEWPSQPELPSSLDTSEVRAGLTCVATAPSPASHWDLIYRYSSLNTLLRITALCTRFIGQLRNSLDTPSSLISPKDLQQAKLFWIKATQTAYFSHEIKLLTRGSLLHHSHAFSRLTAFLDQEGVMRVGGRLKEAQLNYEERHPAILPRHSPLSNLIIDQAHRATLHGGTQLTLSKIRQTTWIIGGRAPVKSYILRCIVCARQRGARAQQLMSQLPSARVTPSRPFSHTGVDYAGPITLKTWKGRGAKTHKGWICVFVCLTTSAVHLEVVSDYSTDGFLATYRRFSSRRGLAQTIHSDCGTNFIGADKELKRLFAKGSREVNQLTTALSKEGTEWKFNSPASPHMGGKWEAVVKSIKFHLRRTIGETQLTFEEYSTLLTQIEAVLNSRPLEPLSDDPEDISALTPGHFLIGGALNSVPEPSLIDLSTPRLSRWQFIQQKVQQFWSQWSAHYLQRQQAISKWHHPSTQIKVGTLVLLTDERLPPSKWPLARVLELHPGKDELTRIVTIKTATAQLTRPIVKLAPLPIRS